MSKIGWIDFSSSERKRVQDALALLSEKGTLDELGVGQIRDAFSDRLFPGFSTVQTSVKYFIFVPRIFCDWEDMSTSTRQRGSFDAYLKDAENLLAKTLVANHKNAKLDYEGIIGHTLVDKGGVARRPSSVYWNGLRVFGIVRTDQSLGEFSKTWNEPAAAISRTSSDDGDDDVVHRHRMVRVDHGHGQKWMDKARLRLTADEATFLLERIEFSDPAQKTATSQLVTKSLIKEVQDLKTFAAFEDWSGRSTLSADCKATIHQAQQFSLAVEGAHIRFNSLVASKIGSTKLKSKSDEAFADWQQRVAQREVFGPGAAAGWLMSSGVGSKIKSKSFLEDWTHAMTNRASTTILDALVKKQAIYNKPDRSVLLKPPKQEPEWVGMRELDFRWRTVRSMLKELAIGADHAHG